MPSHLRTQSAFAPFSAHTTSSSYPHTTSPPPAKRQRKMTVTQTYRLVHSARGKLTREAQRNEHDLRLLVGHANLLDSLMLELEHAEEEQRSWYDATVKPEPRSWATTTTIAEDNDVDMADASDSDSLDSDSDSYDEEVKMVSLRAHGKPQYLPQLPAHSEDSDSDEAISDSDSEASDEEDEEEEDDADSDISDDEDAHSLGLALCRTRSHSETRASHPPDLVHDSSDDSSDDEASSPPQSPPQQPLATLDYTGAKSNFGLLKAAGKPVVQPQQQAAEAALYEDGFYIPSSHAIPQSTMIAPC